MEDVSQAREWFQAKTKNLKALSDKLQASLKKIEQVLYKEDPILEEYYELVEIFEKLKNQSKKIDHEIFSESFIKELNAFIESLETQIDSLKNEKIIMKLTKRLSNEIKKFNLQFEGAYPNLRIGLFSLKIDDEKGEIAAWYGTEQHLIEKRKLSEKKALGSVVKAIHDGIKNLNSSPFDLKDYADNLLIAYKNALSKVKNNKKFDLTDQKYVSIADIYAELLLLKQPSRFWNDPTRKNFAEYTRMQFSYDLFRLKSRIKETNLEIKFLTASREFTKEKSRYIWIPKSKDDLKDGEAISHISITLKNRDLKDNN